MKQGHSDAAGIALSLLSGAVASAGAYVLWYTLLPSLGSITASILQLSVPCLAMLGGVVFLGESLTVRTIFSALAVLTGIVMVTREKSPVSRWQRRENLNNAINSCSCNDSLMLITRASFPAPASD